MAGNIQRPKHQRKHVVEEIEVELSTSDTIALALAMCPEGEAIEIHAASCEDPANRCGCNPRRIVKGAAS